MTQLEAKSKQLIVRIYLYWVVLRRKWFSTLKQLFS